MKGEVVIKLGGSLFTQPALMAPISTWIDGLAESNLKVSIVAGGGKFVDAIRELNFDDKAAHELACEALAVTSTVAGKLLGLPVRDPKESSDGPVIRDLSRWALGQGDIPRDWTVTSDSIAALWAAQRNADALVLVKSIAPPSRKVFELIECGFVDRFFQTAVAGLDEVRIACVEGESCVAEFPLE